MMYSGSLECRLEVMAMRVETHILGFEEYIESDIS